MTIHVFPTINASLNLLAGIFLLLGWRAIKRGERDIHKKWMVCALCASTIFLVCYVTYHTLIHGVTHYQRQGILRFIYFFILMTHTPLAAIIPPAAGVAVFHALKGNFQSHTKITKWLYPVWMYVSVTGVIIYLMLYIF